MFVVLLLGGVREPVLAGTELRPTCNKPVVDALARVGYTRNEIRHVCLESSQYPWGTSDHDSGETAHAGIDGRVDAPTAYKNGIAYRYGRGVPSDLDLSAKYLEFSAARGYLAAEIALADAYRLGQGEDINAILARQWYQKAAAQGSAEAAYSLLGMQHRGDIPSLPLNVAQALAALAKKNGLEPLPIITWQIKACGAEQRTYWAVAGYSKGQIEYECWASWSVEGNLLWAARSSDVITRPPDNRYEVDRLSIPRKGILGTHSITNSRLDGIGVVDAIQASGKNYWGTGFLIDQCHVLTNQHVAYGRFTVNPPPGQRVKFLVGEAAPESTARSLGGMRFEYSGAVVDSGGTIDRVPGGVALSKATDSDFALAGNDWAVIKLDSTVDPALPIMELRSQLGELAGATLYSSGFPGDRNNHFKPGTVLKMWGSSGKLTRLIPGNEGEAVILNLIQANHGQSGSPIYIPENDRQDQDAFAIPGMIRIGPNGPVEHATQFTVIGMVSSAELDDAQADIDEPSIGVLFTPMVLRRINEAVADSPCR